MSALCAPFWSVLLTCTGTMRIAPVTPLIEASTPSITWPDSKIAKVLDSKPTKSVGHFEENKFSVGCHQLLLDFCSKLIKTYNFGQKFSQWKKTKMNNIVQSGCLILKLLILFVDFPSAIVSFFYREPRFNGLVENETRVVIQTVRLLPTNTEYIKW